MLQQAAQKGVVIAHGRGSQLVFFRHGRVLQNAQQQNPQRPLVHAAHALKQCGVHLLRVALGAGKIIKQVHLFRARNA